MHPIIISLVATVTARIIRPLWGQRPLPQDVPPTTVFRPAPQITQSVELTLRMEIIGLEPGMLSKLLDHVTD